MTVRVNSAGRANAARLIEAGKISTAAGWSFSAADGDRILGEPPDWGEYSKWFLAIDDEAERDTKERFKYPFGKNGKVYRSGVIAAKSRAAQQGAGGIAKAADALLAAIDREVSMDQKGLIDIPIFSGGFLYRPPGGDPKYPYMKDGQIDQRLLVQAIRDLSTDLSVPDHIRAALMRRARRIATHVATGKDALLPLSYKSLDVASKGIDAKPNGVVEGYYGAFGNLDDGDDILYKGSTLDSVAARGPDSQAPLVRLLYGHQKDKVLGRPVWMGEDEYGAIGKAQYNLETFWGNEVFALVRAGDLTTQSFGYLPSEMGPGGVGKGYSFDEMGRMHLHRVDVHEFGPLPFAMNSSAVIVSAKGLDGGEGVPFLSLVEQTTNAITDLVIEAEALVSRRIERPTGRNWLSEGNVKSLQGFIDLARAGIEDLESLLAQGPAAKAEVEATADPDYVKALQLSLELTRARLRQHGITEVDPTS